MTALTAAMLRGVPLARASFAWDLAYFAVTVSTTAYVLIGDPVKGNVAIGGLIAGLATAWMTFRLAVQVHLRATGAVLRLDVTSKRVRITEPLTWFTGQEITASQGEPVTVAVSTDNRAIYLMYARYGPLASVPRRDHVVIVLTKGMQRLRVSVYARPDQAWIDSLVDDLASAGITVVLDA